ncbi:iron complex outermembrane recepter protein [Chryseolinea serpens]|uniref:Iron complex outermembrane recepter protein n=1 Tax=Chryseolinea serpens TaxID=947013 RepID=A0A1M5VQW6_9BACT|nr:SusC/RagA family TonB-linked outer membrane protein [Chryseolinea serpens]SHH77632.1 iron complex outermembrane recepter protein [Chryseolinea serpens]
MKKRLLYLSVIFVMIGFTAYGQTVTGTVTSSSDASALPGVSVLLKGSTTGTTTDSDGHFAIQVPEDDKNATLVFSFIGFATQEILVAGKTTIDVPLETDMTQLGEVVVTALGISREKKALGYATSTISSDQITAAGNTNFASALYGKAPGVRITTAPGGATSAVNVQIRGINSINAKGNQPLYVVDGVMIRNMEQSPTGTNNGGYWDDQKIRGNGILDINPADIESLNILKGASAAALYGSEASNGVIVITTKKGTKRNGLGVDFNYNFTVEKVAFTPKYQNTYGPGYDRETNIGNFGANEEGFIPVDTNGDGVNDAVRPIYRAWAQFGPRMDGRQVAWWDGSTRAYSAQPDNYKDLYRTGSSSNFNIAVSNSTDRGSFRLSYTRLDYKGISRGSDLGRNTFNLNSTVKLSNKVSADIVVNYINNKIHNRPEQINRLAANYGGFFSRADYMDVYLNKYQTSQGYKYVTYDQPQKNPAEAIKYNIRAVDLLEYLWRNVRDNDDEYQDRIISSTTLNYEIAKGLKVRGRVGNDFTSVRNEIERHNEYPTSFNTSQSTGSYSLSTGRYSIFYTDALLTYSKDLNKDFAFSVMGGFQSRSQNYIDQKSSTEGGLVQENWFSLNNSYGVKSTSSARTKATMYAYLGMVNLSFKEYLYLEATARQEYTSTLPPGHNGYFYPSANLGFVFSDAFQLPSFISLGKIRVSQARIANGSSPYAANVVYSQQTLATTQGTVTQLQAANNYGNSNIAPERKTETELGLEMAFFQNKLGLDATVYKNTIKDQIIDQSLAPSNGASSVLANLGELSSKGIEIGLSATPYNSGNFRWDTRLSFAKSVTRVMKLAPGMDEMTFYNADAGAVLIKAKAGDVLGDIYTHTREKDSNGNYIINSDGYYQMTTGNDYEKVGNVLPKGVGGWSNTVTYKGLSLNFLIDYRYGGQLVSAPHLYAYGAGMYESTMQYRDAEHGGLSYNIDGSGNKVQAANGQYHDGLILDGVTTTGEKNTKILDAANYYINSYYWASGLYEKQGVLKNDYIKMREVSLSYNLPRSIAQKLRFQNLKVSVIGRNLFYLYRTMKDLDPEVAIGSSWQRQGIDEGSLAATRSLGFSLNGSF